jgi:hypothetical protein
MLWLFPCQKDPNAGTFAPLGNTGPNVESL